MKSIKIFVTFIFCFTIEVVSEKNIKGEEKENILNSAEIYFARVFEDELMKLKGEYPLRLSEDILSIKILNKSTTLNNYDAFDVFQWKSQNFVLGASNNETCMFLVTFSDGEAVLREFIKVEHLNFVEHVDYLKVLINDDTLWIFETSDLGNAILVIRIKFDAGISTSTFQQVITSNPLLDIHPYIHRNLAGLGVMSKETNETTKVTIFSEENGIFLRQFEETLFGRYRRMNSFVDNQNSYLVFIGEQKTVIERYDGNKTEELWNSSMKTEIFFSQKDEISHNLFMGFIRDENVDLYLFRDEKLLDWNKIPTGSEVKIGHVFTFKFRLFFILANLSKISVYSQNAEGNYFPKWVIYIPCDLKKVDAVMGDEGIVFASFCEDARKGFYFHHLRIVDEYVPELQSDSPQDELRVEKCLDELENVLKRNELLIPGLMNSVQKGGFLRADISIPMWEDRREEDLTVVSSSNKLDDVRTEVDNLAKIVATLKNKTRSLEDELPNLLTYEGNQHIITTVIASKMVANYSILMSIDLEKLNEITLDDYRTKFMVMDRPQIVNTNFIFDEIATKNVNAKSLSTGSLVILPENLLDNKNPNQIITGQHIFSSLEVRDDIVSSNPGIDNEINDININDIVSKFSDVSFEGRQEFQKTLVSEEYLKIKYLNEVDYDVWSQSVMKSKNGASHYFGISIVVEGNVRVAGNVKTVAVNGIDFNTLYGNIAKKSSLVQEFSDKMEFRNGLEVENLEVERVNGHAWSNYLRKRDEKVGANFYIDDGVILTDLKSEDINGLNFGKDVLLSGPDQIINGRITLVSDVDVTSSNGVTMETGATVNAFDPSLYSQIGQFSNNEIFDKKLNFGDVLIINGDIRVKKLNNATFPDFNGFWTKSDQLRIPNTVAISKADFRKSLYASTLNNFEVSDYVRSDVPQTLMARNFFVSNVLVDGDIYMENNRTINKVDLSALKNSALTLHRPQIINGLTEFTKILSVNNFISKDGTLKGINIQDDLVVLPHRFQNSVLFTSLVEAHSLHTKDIQVGKLNGRDPLETIYDRGTSISEIKGDLYAERVKVNELIFTKNLNGENFNKWISFVASKEKSSLVFSEKVTVRGDVTFAGALNVNFLNSKHLKTFVKQLNRDCDECEVRGTKSFTKPVEVFGNLFAEYINGVSLHELKERLLSRTKEQTVKGIFKFKGGLTSVKIEAPKISGISVEEIVLVNNINLELPTKFKSDVSFDEVLSKDGWIDGCKLEEISNPPFSNVGNFNHNISFGHLEISGNMIMEGKLLLRAIRGDLRNFVRKLVTKSSDQNIYGEIRFQNEAWIQSLNSKYVNKLRSQEFTQKFTERRRDVQTNCNIEVEELLVNEAIASNVWAEAINNVKLKTISNFGVNRSSAQEVIRGKKIFPNAVVNGNFKVKRINNVDFEDLVKLDEDNSDLKLVFMKSISFATNVWVYGLIADENANSLFKHFDPTTHSSSVPFPSKYDQLIIEGDLNVNAVNNVRLDDLFLKTAKSWIVTGKKNFIGGVIIEGESKIDVINGFRPNQFKGGPFTTPQEMVGRFSADEMRAKPLKNPKVALSELIFVLQRVNENNFKQIKVMFRKLFSITRAAEVHLPGDRIHSLRMSRSTLGHVFVEYDACLSRNLCPCFDTYTLTINRSKLELESESFKGRNFYILLSAENRLYNFNVGCSASEIFTSIGQFQLSAEGAVVLTQETKVFNLVQVLHFGGSERTYFLLYTKKGKDNEISTLTAVNSNFEALWDITFDARIAQLVLQQVFEDWYLLVVINQMEQNAMLLPEESRLYSWNANKEQFVLIRNLPAAASGDLTVFGNEIFLVLGFNNPEVNGVHEEKRSDVQIYKSVERMPFEAFSSLTISEAGSVVLFTVDEALYLAVASRSGNSVSVYRRILQEGFTLEESIFIINPSELNYLNIEGRHYLLLLNDNSVTLLNLNFKGVSVKNIL